MPIQVTSPSNVIATARAYIGLVMTQNGDAVALGGDATAVQPVGVCTDATLVQESGTDVVLLTLAVPGERVELIMDEVIDVSAGREVAFDADGEGIAASAGDYIVGLIADTTGGDTAVDTKREIIVQFTPVVKVA